MVISPGDMVVKFIIKVFFHNFLVLVADFELIIHYLGFLTYYFIIIITAFMKTEEPGMYPRGMSEASPKVTLSGVFSFSF